ncbi:prepilin-type N-terminal cleavage/methylation domain-containing protein [Planomicrobium sp. Y74]|uniref:prepilin-type N-terminal cleavage/methylation domain-containing protein n=1 Tax=Planomicrobium sp. Y74 TaxID=2478977 RepID=UPI000EF4F195|nr:prepilin-type N-terminal cleavage/methylation domain-containing protein [Planomicrobium sp. Y74]RLQ91985.1 prepilin-type N-terminal cleavage/methylation domain-containing protein [Planomicrobium sp. Y74]
MKKFLKKKLGNEKGMTLIELLAVIVILAIIAAIAIPAISNIIENSRVGAVKSDAQMVLSAANLYYTDDPTAASPVTVTTLLANDYLQDAGSLTAATSVAKITGGNEITGQGSNGVVVDFLNATNEEINAVPNNSPTGGTGVTITR